MITGRHHGCTTTGVHAAAFSVVLANTCSADRCHNIVKCQHIFLNAKERLISYKWSDLLQTSTECRICYSKKTTAFLSLCFGFVRRCTMHDVDVYCLWVHTKFMFGFVKVCTCVFVCENLITHY